LGSNLFAFFILISLWRFVIITSISGENSIITCLQAPQGEQGSIVSQTIAIALNF